MTESCSLHDLREACKKLDTVIVVPSISIDAPEILGLEYYESRLAWTVLNASDRLKIALITTHPCDEAVRHFARISGREEEILRNVDTLSVVDKTEPAPYLSCRLLEDSSSLESIHALLKGRTALVAPFLTTEYEIRLAKELGIPIYAPDEPMPHVGTKSGAYKLFKELGIEVPEGKPDVFSVEQAAEAMVDILYREGNESQLQFVLKLNEGYSGLQLRRCRVTAEEKSSAKSHQQRLELVISAIDRGKFVSEKTDYEAFKAQLAEIGGLVQLWVEGAPKFSPSGQFYVDSEGNYRVLSSHEQKLQGDTKYIGATLGADSEYRQVVDDYTEKIAARIAELGFPYYSSVDYVTTCDDCGRWRVYAIEINLSRQGGTIYHLRTAELLTGASYDSPSGMLVDSEGRQFTYVCSDNLLYPRLAGHRFSELENYLDKRGLIFDPSVKKGLVLQLGAAVEPLGKFGGTFIASSIEEAASMMQRLDQVMAEFPADSQT